MFEELEQIPWSELIAKPKRPRRWVVVALAIVIGLVLLVVRLRIPVSTSDALVPTAPETPPPARVASEPAVMVSEADLHASSESGELLALGAAVVEVRATSTPTHYVEWAVAEGLTPLGKDRWSVQVAFQVLVSAFDGPERTPIRRVDVPIEVIDGRAGRIGPFHLTHYEPGPTRDAWEVEETPVTPAMTEVVGRMFESWGDVTVDAAGTHDGLVRVMVDTGALKVSIWLDGNAVVPAVPAPATAP